MKKLLFIFVLSFCFFDLVCAGCNENVESDPESGGKSDSRMDATVATNNYNSVGINNSCGPYVSYKDIVENNNIYFIVRTAGDEYYNVQSDKNDTVGVVKVSDLPENGCPDNLRNTNEYHSFYEKNIFDTKEDKENGYFYAKESLTVCAYNLGKNNVSIVTYDNYNLDDQNRVRHIYIAANSLAVKNYELFLGNNRSDSGIWFKGKKNISNSEFLEYMNRNNYDTDFLLGCPDNISAVKHEDKYYIFPSKGLADIAAKSYNTNSEEAKSTKTFAGAGLLANIETNLEVYRGLFSSCHEDSKCLSFYKGQFDKLVLKYSEYCNSIYSKCNYNDTNVTKCYEIDDTIGEILNEYNINTITDCGISERVLKWIANIFKWVKYFMPALVVILTILDFIKAIGSQNEDYLKKAQGKLVKRIIVAALFFIVPFLLEFVMEAFHLVNDNPYCGLF